ncbi:MAG: hypothetical protein LBK42_10125 [Propionibacteriaceae bacterium]|nr:hypothetical protein [Propionibacteriaceae bacterium]
MLLIDGSASVRTLATDIVSVAVDLVDGVVEASTTGGLRQIGLIGADDVFKVEPGEAILLSARVVAALAERPAQLGAGVSRSTLERLSQSPELTLFASQDDGLGQTGRGLLVVITDDELPDRAQVDSWAKSSDWDWRVILVGEAAEQSAAPQTIRLTSFTADRPQKWAATFMDRPTVLRAAVAKLLESGPD